jgi:hypothetical protein
MGNLIPVDIIQQLIFEIGGEKAMLDRHLAELYGVETQVLNQARNRGFMPRQARCENFPLSRS